MNSSLIAPVLVKMKLLLTLFMVKTSTLWIQPFVHLLSTWVPLMSKEETSLFNLETVIYNTKAAPEMELPVCKDSETSTFPPSPSKLSLIPNK